MGMLTLHVFHPFLISSIDVPMIILSVAAHISIRVVQALAESLKNQLCQAIASKHSVASEILSGFGIFL